MNAYANNSIFAKVAEIVSPIYMVGGGVRDLLMHRQPKDYDFTTPLQPDQIEQKVRASGKRAFTAGKRYGTIGFKIDGELVEITTFRTEKYVSGSRKPVVEFVDNISYDLSRRDFTINAIAIHEDGHLIDPFGGRDDIGAGIIRAVGKPHLRFSEDPLRLLRAARFAAQFDFVVEQATFLQLTKKADKILHISKERWVQELDKILVTDNPDKGLRLLAESRLIHYMIPELATQIGMDQDSPYHELDLWEHTLKTVRLVPNEITLRWAALLHDIGKPFTKIENKYGYSNYAHHSEIGAELVSKIGPYLKWPNTRTKKVMSLVLTHMVPESPLKNADSSARFKHSPSPKTIV